MKKIRVITRKVKANGKEFEVYQMVGDGGRLVDLRFCKDVDKTPISGMNKFEVEAELSDASSHYEYPRFYVTAMNPETLVKIS